jgi:hypothetical protein
MAFQNPLAHRIPIMIKPTVDDLCALLKEMEREAQSKKLFVGGRSYPPEMCEVPFSLVGQGFFPGGDGLWREEGQLAEPATSKLLPIGGIMFVGQDFGNAKEYKKLAKKCYEHNSPTWRNLRLRVKKARKVPTQLIFASNAMMGLRKFRKSNEDMCWHTDPTMKNFAAFCERFFAVQIGMMEPRLIVVFDSIKPMVTRWLRQSEPEHPRAFHATSMRGSPLGFPHARSHQNALRQAQG